MNALLHFGLFILLLAAGDGCLETSAVNSSLELHSALLKQADSWGATGHWGQEREQAEQWELPTQGGSVSVQT